VNVLVSGASSQIGRFLLPMLVERGDVVMALSRKRQPKIDGVRWICADLDGDAGDLWRQLDCQAWIHLAFLPLALAHLEAAVDSGVRQFIAFSSTSIFTKTDSDNSREQAVVQQLRQAEASVAAAQFDVGWTILRPTLIYGCGNDQNIAFIASMIRRFGLFPLAGTGEGVRQPVHAADLAAAAVAALENEQAYNRAYNLSGGEALSYRAMVERVFASLGRRPRLISVPPLLLKAALQLLRLFPGYRHLSSTMIDRMQRDMVFDHRDAAADLGFKPRRFEP